MPPPVHGAAMMGKYIHDSQVINNAFDCHYINLTTAKDLSNIGKFGLKKVWSFLKLLYLIYYTVRKIRPQLVYITSNACGVAFYKDFIVVEMLKILGCKVVAHYHNKGVVTRQDKLLDNFLYKIFFKNLKVILLSAKLYDDVKKYVRREDVKFCPNGIPDDSSVDENINHKGRNEVPHILFLSNLIETKGVFILLDALKILKDKGYSFVCNFVGGETNEIDAARFIAEVNKRGLNNAVVYVGKKYGIEKSSILDKSDIFVLPTYYECFPLVLLEAMQHRLPCISSDEGGITDIIDNEKTGFVIPKKSVKDLVLFIERVLIDRELCVVMGQRGYNKYKKQFTLDIFEHKLCEIINALT